MLLKKKIKNKKKQTNLVVVTQSVSESLLNPKLNIQKQYIELNQVQNKIKLINFLDIYSRPFGIVMFNIRE